MMIINGIHRENLQKLATFLMYGEKPKEVKFDMGLFTRAELNGENDTVCRTAGCAVGFAPFAGIEKHIGETFTAYGSRTLVEDSTSKLWEWLFSGGWFYEDNTPEGAAKRIQYFLNGGEIPSDFDYEDITDDDVDIYRDVEVNR
jgi:hypothetical protein